jgi:alpha-N-arabinofuranosidase
MMKETAILLHTAFQIGAVYPRMFGGFLEHIGQAGYEGVYQPDSAPAEADGWRSDVLAALAELRYPGGNFASGYHWVDGIGPKAERPLLARITHQSSSNRKCPCAYSDGGWPDYRIGQR